PRPRPRADADLRDQRPAQLQGPGADLRCPGARATGRHRLARRWGRLGRGPPRVADGPAAVSGGYLPGYAGGRADRGASAAAALEGGHTARSGDDLLEGAGEAAGEALLKCRGVGRRPAAGPCRPAGWGAASGGGGEGGGG